MTGNSTNAAIALVHGSMIDFLRRMALISAFVFGGFLTGYLGGNYDNFNLGHSYGRIFLAGLILLIFAEISNFLVEDGILFCVFCSMACGLQNAMTTKFSGNMIRTTHITGSLTDIGLTLGRMARGRIDGAWKLGLLVPMTLTFFIGGVLGTAFHHWLGKSAILLNILFYGGTGVIYTIYFSKYFKVSYYRAIFENVEFMSFIDKARDDYDFMSLMEYRESTPSANDKDYSFDKNKNQDEIF